MGYNVTEGLNKYIRVFMGGQDKDKLPSFLIHPLYVELQQQSPLSDPNYTIAEVDKLENPIGKH